MKLLNTSLVLCGMLIGLFSCQHSEPYKYEYLYKNLPFDMPRVKEPVFAANEVNLKDYGAIGNGEHLCTESFAQAIDALVDKGVVN